MLSTVILYQLNISHHTKGREGGRERESGEIEERLERHRNNTCTYTLYDGFKFLQVLNIMNTVSDNILEFQLSQSNY